MRIDAKRPTQEQQLLDRISDLHLARAFVRRHFSLAGTIALHRHAIGLDLLRAPINVMLAPVFLLARVLAFIVGWLGFRRTAISLARQRLHFPSDLGRAMKAAIVKELIVPRMGEGTRLTGAQAAVIEDYVTVRSAVCEIATTLAVVMLGIVAFQVLTPGVLSLAPVIADRAAHAREIAQFPLGPWLGEAWYLVFPANRPLWPIIVTGGVLVIAFSLVTTFAGLVADPVQAVAGIHRRRLMRLLARFDRHAEDTGTIERELIIARGADIADAAATLLRVFRP